MIYGSCLFSIRNWLSLLTGSAVFLFLMAIFSAPLSANESEQNLLERARITQHIEQQQQLLDNGNISNASIIQQIGNNNNASVVQSQSASYQAGNFAFIYQNGNQNNADIFQQGGNHTAVIWQVGNSHNAEINQQNNSLPLNADIHQFGIASDIKISQSGYDQRSISIEQHTYSGNALPVIVETH
ncbi:hypothetical protein R5M92_15970 [Halomonas sp. Bachu 37]|uniref:hypothetical protein n=1 Tax=Halomonas kashgarensis TaxID=3084920 RepID=UPI003217557F